MAERPPQPAQDVAGHQRFSQEKVLRPVTLFIDLPDANTQVEVMFKEPDRLARTTRELRELAASLSEAVLSRRILVHAEEGTLGVERQDVPLDALLSEVQRLCREAPWGQGRPLEILPGAGGNLRTDAALLLRVLAFLLANAFEADGEDPVTLQVEADAGGHTLCVHNAGILAENVAPRVFQRGFTTKGKSGGGMGCYAARLLTERYLGGSLSFQSEAAQGTQFLLRLPKGFQERSKGVLTAPHPEAGAPEPPPPAPGEAIGTVLVVDDSLTTRQVLASVLAREHLVLTANDGPDCLKIARDQAPDLILLDIVMPGMDGYAVCAHLKSDPRTEEIPVLFLTGLTGEGDETLALEAGAIDFITKPISPVAVAARVRNHMELKRTRDRLRELSFLDGLTGIANRRRFDKQVEVEWQRARRRGLPLSLILGDVDEFKRYNDYYGHAQGDAALRSVAHAFLRAPLRAGDLVARYGGEEFVCLLPDTEGPGAMEVAQRILQELRIRAIPHANSAVGPILTLSLGVASMRPGEGNQLQDLFERADVRLYEAKHAGRDRVCG